MSSISLKVIVKDDGHLGVVCCPIEGEPPAASQLGTGAGTMMAAMMLCAALLGEIGAEPLGDRSSLSADAPPDWVWEVGVEHGPDSVPESGWPAS